MNWTYRIVTSYSANQMAEEVSACMIDGWRCQGPVSVVAAAGRFFYAQAMVKIPCDTPERTCRGY